MHDPIPGAAFECGPLTLFGKEGMSSPKLILNAGPADDALIVFGGREVFATARSYILLSPQSLDEEDSALILDASYWWFDAGRDPEIMRIERRKDRVVLVGRKRIEQTHGDSNVVLGECDLSEWIVAVQKLKALLQEPNFEGSAAPERAAGPRLNKPGND